MKKRIWILLGVVVLVLVIVAVWKKRKAPSGFEVTVEQVEPRRIVEVVSATGTVQPEKEVAISPEVPGEIIELPVLEGQKVKQGELLVRINPDVFLAAVNRALAGLNSAKANAANSRARLEQAKARLINARAAFERQEKLYKDKVVSDADYERAQADYEVAKAEEKAADESVRASEFSIESAQATLNEARDNLKRTTIYAPMDGTVSKLDVEQGERVVGTAQMAGTEMMRVADLTHMEVNAEVNESDIVRVQLGDRAEIEVDAYVNRTFEGIVTEIANSSKQSALQGSDQVTVFNVKVRIQPESYQDLIDTARPHLSPFRPGMSASVEVFTSSVDGALSVPIQAVTIRPDSNQTTKRGRRVELDDYEEDDLIECVFIAVNGKAEKRQVVTGIQDSRYMEIRSGLKEGETVITGPYSIVAKKLIDGDEILVREKSDLFEKGSDQQTLDEEEE